MITKRRSRLLRGRTRTCKETPRHQSNSFRVRRAL